MSETTENPARATVTGRRQGMRRWDDSREDSRMLPVLRCLRTPQTPRHRAVRCAAVLLAAVCLAAVLPVLPLRAQGSWPTTHQQATWLSLSIDEPVTARTALWFDGNWRRMGWGAEPQQVLLRPGILRTIAPGVRVGTGYAYVATAPYGELPADAPVREHRLWQQLSLAQTIGRVSLTHRYRWEQRWIAAVADGTVEAYHYQQRARYMVRAQRPIGRGPVARSVFLQEEVLLPVGHGGSAGRFTQNRFGLGIGLPMGEGRRLDIGYLNLWNAVPSRSANEVNHTLTVAWVLTGR